MEESRRGNEPSIQQIEPDEPIAEPVPNAKPTVVVAPEPAVRAPGVDRPAARAKGLALPDEYLDPAWPSDGSETRIPHAQSDNVQEVPIEDGQLDGAEREEAHHYNEALGQYKDPEEFTEDNWGNDPAQRTRQGDVDEYEDPAEW
jgi:hypothetical protein